MQSRGKFLIIATLVCSIVFCFCVDEALAQNSRSSSIVTIDGESYYVHTVVSGETLYSLSKLYGVTEDEIKRTNPQTSEGLQTTHVLKIKALASDQGSSTKKMSDRKIARTFDQHTVNKGETAYSICQRYGLSLTTLLDDNLGLDPSAIPIGQRLNIRKKSVGESVPEQITNEMKSYRDAANSVSTDYKLHLVAKGETIYSLCKMYDITQQQLETMNNLQDGMKAGMMIKIPPVEEAVISDIPIESPPISITPPDKEPDYISQTQLSPREFATGEQIDVAMLLPLQSGTTPQMNFLDFYQGALIALEDLKRRGIGVELNLYNTDRSQERVSEIVNRDEFRDTDLIIGPIYDDCFEPVIRFAEQNSIAVVSPLANMDVTQSSVLYQMAPTPSTKNEKLKLELSDDKNIVIITTENNDEDFEREITAIAPPSANLFSYSKRSTVSALESLIKKDQQNVFIVLSGNESTVDEFLARISSVQNNLLARSIRSESITIVGTSKWLKFQNIDKNLYFKLGLSFVSSYHADRSNPAVISFDKRYISVFKSMPSLYSYRGYDVVKLFVSNIGNKQYDRTLTEILNDGETELLQMRYKFSQSDTTRNNTNHEWGLVKYKNDYTIEVR